LRDETNWGLVVGDSRSFHLRLGNEAAEPLDT